MTTRRTPTRLPRNAEPEVIDAFREIHEYLNRVFGRGTIDIGGSRITNGGLALGSTDLVTRYELDKISTQVRALHGRVGRISTQVDTPSAPTTTTPPIDTGGLPAADHAIDFGYYYAGYTFGADRLYLNYLNEVKPWTNTYVAVTRTEYVGGSDAGIDVWGPIQFAAMDLAKSLGMKNYFLVGQNSPQVKPYIPELLTLLTPLWDSVSVLDIGDEPDWTKAQMEDEIGQLRDAVTAAGLAMKPIGYTPTTVEAATSDVVTASGLDFVNVECYIPEANASSDPAANAALLNASIDAAMSNIPTSKDISFTLKGYTQGLWVDFAAIAAFQPVAYLKAYNVARVKWILIFAYARPNGTKDHPELATKHQQIWNAISNSGGGDTGGGGLPHGCTRNPTSLFGAAVTTEIQNYLNVHYTDPLIFIPGSNPPKFVNFEACVPAYLSEVANAIQNGGYGVICRVDPNSDMEIEVKYAINPTFDEHYAIVTSQSTVRRPPGAYTATCGPPSGPFQ